MIGFWLFSLGIGLGALFSTLHLALVDLSRGALEEIATVRNNPRALARVRAILDRVSDHARAVAVPRVICDAGAVIGALLWIISLRGTPGVDWIDATVAVAAAAAALWVFGIVVPMALAWYVGERMVYAFSGLVRACFLVLKPLHVLPATINEVVRRLAGAKSGDQAEVLEAELLSVVEEGEREGQFDEAERDMIEAVFEFRNLTAEQVMTPRTEIEAFELTNDLGAVTRIIRETGHSRIPVYEGSLDNIVGIFYVKDLMRWLAGEGGRSNGKPFDLREILRPALFVPETKPVRELLRELLAKKVHIAMVADEYGGISGLLTIEDIVEEIVGEIHDEYEDHEPEDEVRVEVKPDEFAAVIDARAYIEDANDALEPLRVRLPEGDDYDTVGGFVVTTLGRIPEPGETFTHDRATLTVLESTPTRVVRVRVEVPAFEPERPVEAGASRADHGGDGDGSLGRGGK